MASPNVEGTSNPTATGGNTMGVVVGSKVAETVGFYGATGVAQQTVAITGNAVVDSAATITALKALGLFA